MVMATTMGTDSYARALKEEHKGRAEVEFSRDL